MSACKESDSATATIGPKILGKTSLSLPMGEKNLFSPFSARKDEKKVINEAFEP